VAERVDHLAAIVARKRVEVARRLRRATLYAAWAERTPAPLREQALGALRRSSNAPPRVIAEIKLRSPSAGQIRPRVSGEIAAIAASYQGAGAAAVSVLCDGPGFGGSPLDLRRVASRVSVPVLFKEFVLHSVQLDLARAVGASLVLLLVRVLEDAELASLVREARRRGLEPVVEAADQAELERALATEAAVVGINARDLRSFTLDAEAAARLVDRIPRDRVGVFMSGVRNQADFDRVAATRADCVLIGEGLMSADDPYATLAGWLAGSQSRG
jgi:indole-3-glycerol phosphate synthase